MTEQINARSTMMKKNERKKQRREARGGGQDERTAARCDPHSHGQSADG